MTFPRVVAEELSEFTFTARVELLGLISGMPDGGIRAGRCSRWSSPAPRPCPPPGLLEERALPVVVSPGVEQVAWRLTLPPGWCPIAAQE